MSRAELFIPGEAKVRVGSLASVWLNKTFLPRLWVLAFFVPVFLSHALAKSFLALVTRRGSRKSLLWDEESSVARFN